MSTVEGYELHVYCDDPEHFDRTCASQENWRRYSGPGQYCGQTKHDAYALARRAGWVIRRTLPGTEATNGGLPARCKMCTDALQAVGIPRASCVCGHDRGDHGGHSSSNRSGRYAFTACGACECQQWRPRRSRQEDPA